jgi:chemosensory pili system protein ChpA (sensor histidine kinase/response regulator)
MDGPVNPGVAAAFIAEALSYLPKILEALEVNGPDLPAADAAEHTSLEEAHRLVHTIGGAAAIVGFPTVSERAKTVELELETLVSSGASLDPDAARRLQFMVCEIGAEVDKIAAESMPPGDFVDDGWGEPTGAEGDEAIVADDSFEVIGATGFDDESALIGDESFGEEPFGEEDNHPPAAAAADAPFQLPVDDVVPPELMDVFVVEAADHLQTIARTLSALHGNPQDRATLQELRRSVHTLKGAAGMVGFRTVSQLAHRMEDLLDALYDGDIPSTQDTTAVLFAGADVLHHLVTGEGNQAEIRQGIPALYARLTASLKGEPAPAAAATPPADAAPLPAPPRPSQTTSSTKSSTANYALPPDPDRAVAKPARTVGPKGSSGARRSTKARQHVRVAVDRLDELINLVGEMVINRSAFQQYLANISRELQELGQSVGRLRLLWSKLETEYELGTPMGRSARRAAAMPTNDMGRPSAAEVHGFDELEFDQYTESHLLSRQLSETVGDIDAVSHQLHESITSFEGDFSKMRRLTTDAQDRLLRLRMVPIGTQATKLERVVRMTAESRGKHVDFTLEGESVALDRPILDEVSDALLHLLRNAVDHGVEGPTDRTRVGKNERAKVSVRASYEGAHAIIQVTDDGRGLNFERMRDVAVRDGFLLPEDAAAMTERELQMLIFRPKFSTAQEISEVSGRGVGLDVVKEKIQQLNGTVSVASTPGHGATFTLRLPLTLAVARVLLVKAGGQTFALPAPTITRVLRVDREDVERDGEVREVALEGVQYPATHVLKALGAEERQEDKSARVSALILASPDNPAALIVDQFLEARDVVVTMLTGHLRRVRGLAGATVLGDGQVVIILNPDELLSQTAAQRTGVAAVRQMPAPIDQQARSLRILVVDDSLSVRQVLANLVRRVGWTPLVARDGLEALETLQREPMLPDLIFSDVEMPRMDGYELTSTVKADPKMKRVPVVFITSRAGDKHRRRGFEVGAAGYLVKPFDEQALLTLVARLTGVQPDHGLVNETGGASASASMTERGGDVTGEQVS